MNRLASGIHQISLKTGVSWVPGIVPSQYPPSRTTPGTPPLDHARGAHDVSAAVRQCGRAKLVRGALIRSSTHLRAGLVAHLTYDRGL